MGAHVLLNLLNELGERYKMRGLPSILFLFRNEFNKLIAIFAVKTSINCHLRNDHNGLRHHEL